MNFETQQSPVILIFLLSLIFGLESVLSIATSFFTKSFVSKCFSFVRFQILFYVMSALEKLRYRDGLPSVDGRANRRGEAPFSTGVVWTKP